MKLPRFPFFTTKVRKLGLRIELNLQFYNPKQLECILSQISSEVNDKLKKSQRIIFQLETTEVIHWSATLLYLIQPDPG